MLFPQKWPHSYALRLYLGTANKGELMTCALLILLQLCLWSSQVWSTTDHSTDCSRCHEQPPLSELALQMQEASVQVNGGSKQHVTAKFVRRSLIRGEEAEQKEVKGTEQGCRSGGDKTNIHPGGRQREML